jgi:hypothetical protein
MANTAAEIRKSGASPQTIACDVRKRAQVNRMVERVIRFHGRADQRTSAGADACTNGCAAPAASGRATDDRAGSGTNTGALPGRSITGTESKRAESDDCDKNGINFFHNRTSLPDVLVTKVFAVNHPRGLFF